MIKCVHEFDIHYLVTTIFARALGGGGEAKYILYSKVLLQKPLPQSRMSEWPTNSFLSGSETVEN